MDPERRPFQQVLLKITCRSPVGLLDELGHRKFTRAVDADEQIELTFGGLNLGGIHLKESDCVALEALRFGSSTSLRRALSTSTSPKGRCRAAAGTSAALTVSDASSRAAKHKGNRRAAAMCDPGIQ